MSTGDNKKRNGGEWGRLCLPAQVLQTRGANGIYRRLKPARSVAYGFFVSFIHQGQVSHQSS